MKRLAGADAQFLYQENRVQHLHTIKIAILDPSEETRTAPFDVVRQQLGKVFPYIAPFRWRLIKVPLRLGHPFWADDPDLDLDYHIRRAAVPAPGGEREFCEVVSYIASFPLERDRPLWQVWIVEGLQGGYVAYVCKVHHALADGGSSAQIFLDAFAESPELIDNPEARPPLERDAIPPLSHRLADALRELFRLLGRMPALLVRTMRVGRIELARRIGKKPRYAAPYSGPETRFNRPLTPHRWYANVTVPLDDVRLVKDAFGVTINDVLLGLSSGAIRSYLAARGELPARPLTASVPISVRRPEEKRTYGNRLATWCISLATDVDDPVERLRAVSRNSRAARDDLASKDPELQHDWMEYWWLWALVVNVFPKVFRKLVRRPLYNVIVSNVRGPDKELSSRGSRLVAIQSMGPLVGDFGLNVTAWSYVDQLSIGIVACHEHVPDVWDLAARFPAALDELKAAAERERKPAPAEANVE